MYHRRLWGQDNVGEVAANVNSSHEEFLAEDDPVKKTDCLRYFSAYAMQWLGLVRQSEKFTLQETDRVLRSSAMNIADFDPREAAISFEYLAKYAHNLLEQPWRVDFHVMKLTSGFYVHNIAAQLVNAHELLVAMGYVHIDETTLKLLPTMDPKKLKIVSRDCLVAAQECLILSQVWQRVADAEPDYPLTIGEVYEARAQYVGDTDTTCKTLLGEIRKRQYNKEYHKKSSMTFDPVDKLIDFDEQTGIRSPYRRREVDSAEVAERAAREVLRHTQAMYNNNVMSTQSSVSSHVKTPHSRRHEYDDVYFEGAREESLSPMIPKTVKEFAVNYSSPTTKPLNNNMNSLASHYRSSSLTSNNFVGGPMTFSKVQQEVLSPQSTTSERRKSQRGSSGEDNRLPSIDKVYYDHLLKQGYRETTSPSDSTTRRRCLNDHVKDLINPGEISPSSPPNSPLEDRNSLRQLEERVNALELDLKTSSSSPSSSTSASSVVPLDNSYRDRSKSSTSQKSPPRPPPPKMDHLKARSTVYSSSPTPTTSTSDKVPLNYFCKHCTFENKNVDTFVCGVCAKSQDFIDEGDATDLPQIQRNDTPKLYSATEEVKESNMKQVECPRCTFHNLPYRHECEMCSFKFQHPGLPELMNSVSPQSFSSAALS